MLAYELHDGHTHLLQAFCRPRGRGQVLATSQVRHTLGLQCAWARY